MVYIGCMDNKIQRNRVKALTEKAWDVQEELLASERTTPALRHKVAQDILDRGGFPKISASSIKNTQVTLTGGMQLEREALLVEFEEINKELKQLETPNE